MPKQRKGTDPKLVSEPAVLADLIAYQDGAVTSRTLIDKDPGTITIFSFDQDEGLSTHSAPFDAYAQILDGAMDITIEETTHRVNTGQVLIMPANKPHGLRAVERSKMLLVMIRA